MSKKAVISNFNGIVNNKSMTYGIKTMWKVFKYLFPNLAEFFLDKLPDPSYKCNLESVFLYYSNFAIPEVFHIKISSEEKVFIIMGNIEISKAIGWVKLPERFLKDSTENLSKPISESFNLSISHGIFLNACKVAKLKRIFKKGKKIAPCNYSPVLSVPLISKITTKKMNSSQTTKYYITISLDSELITWLICLSSLLDKFRIFNW